MKYDITSFIKHVSCCLNLKNHTIKKCIICNDFKGTFDHVIGHIMYDHYIGIPKVVDEAISSCEETALEAPKKTKKSSEQDSRPSIKKLSKANKTKEPTIEETENTDNDETSEKSKKSISHKKKKKIKPGKRNKEGKVGAKKSKKKRDTEKEIVADDVAQDIRVSSDSEITEILVKKTKPIESIEIEEYSNGHEVDSINIAEQNIVQKKIKPIESIDIEEYSDGHEVASINISEQNIVQKKTKPIESIDIEEYSDGHEVDSINISEQNIVQENINKENKKELTNFTGLNTLSNSTATITTVQQVETIRNEVYENNTVITVTRAIEKGKKKYFEYEDVDKPESKSPNNNLDSDKFVVGRQHSYFDENIENPAIDKDKSFSAENTQTEIIAPKGLRSKIKQVKGANKKRKEIKKKPAKTIKKVARKYDYYVNSYGDETNGFNERVISLDSTLCGYELNQEANSFKGNNTFRRDSERHIASLLETSFEPPPPNVLNNSVWSSTPSRSNKPIRNESNLKDRSTKRLDNYSNTNISDAFNNSSNATYIHNEYNEPGNGNYSLNEYNDGGYKSNNNSCIPNEFDHSGNKGYYRDEFYRSNRNGFNLNEHDSYSNNNSYNYAVTNQYGKDYANDNFSGLNFSNENYSGNMNTNENQNFHGDLRSVPAYPIKSQKKKRPISHAQSKYKHPKDYQWPKHPTKPKKKAKVIAWDVDGPKSKNKKINKKIKPPKNHLESQSKPRKNKK